MTECADIGHDNMEWAMRNSEALMGLSECGTYNHLVTGLVKPFYHSFREHSNSETRLQYTGFGLAGDDGQLWAIRSSINNAYLGLKNLTCAEAIKMSSGKKLDRRIRSKEFISRAYKNASFSSKYIECITDSLSFFAQDCVESGVSFDSGLGFQPRPMITANQYMNNQRIAFFAEQDNLELTDEQIRLISQRKNSLKKTRKWHNKVIAKSKSVLKSLYPKYYQVFISGDEVMLNGVNYDFGVKMKNINTMDWSSIKSSVYSKSGDKLSDMCVFFENTPAPEQMVAFATMVNSGFEEEILSKANFYNISRNHADELPKQIKPLTNMSNDRFLNETDIHHIGMAELMDFHIDTSMGFPKGTSKLISEIGDIQECMDFVLEKARERTTVKTRKFLDSAENKSKLLEMIN